MAYLQELEQWRHRAGRWDIRKALRACVAEAETCLPLYEQSLVDGLRTTEPRVPMKPKGLQRRRGEVASMRAFLVGARELLASPGQETLQPWPGWWEARTIERQEEEQRNRAAREHHGLRVIVGGRA